MDSLPAEGKGRQYPIARADRVRLVAFLYRKEGTSSEEFSTYWRETHAHLFASLAIAKRNILKYEQVHANKEALDGFKGQGFQVADYDGYAVFDAPSAEKLAEIFEDKEYKEVIHADEENFIDRKRTVLFAAQVVPVMTDA